MQLFNLALTAGVEIQSNVRGRYFRLLTASGRLNLRVSSGYSSEIIAGIGVDLTGAMGQPFDYFALTSTTDQTVTVLVSDFPTTDSRLSGDIDINGLLSVATVGGNSITETSGTLATATAGTLLAQDLDRIETTVYIDQDIFISGVSPATAAGFPLPAGYHTFKNTAAVYMYNNSGSTLNYFTIGDNK